MAECLATRSRDRCRRATAALLVSFAWCAACAPPAEPPAIDTAPMEAPVAAVISRARAALLADLDAGAAWGRYGMVLHAHDQFHAALECYGIAADLEAGEARWPYYAGVLSAEQDPAESLHWFAEAVARAPDSVAARLRLGHGLRQLGRLQEADTCYAEAARVAPDSGDVLLALGQRALERGELDTALSALQRARERLEPTAAVHAALAQAYRRRGDSESARRESEIARRLPTYSALEDPWMRTVHALEAGSRGLHRRGLELLQAGRVEQALKLLENSIALRPEDAAARGTLGSAYLRAGDPARAEEQFRALLELDENDALGQLYLGVCLARRGELEAAVESFHQALRLAPDDPECHDNLAITYEHLGRTDDALRVRRAAARRFPGDPRFVPTR